MAVVIEGETPILWSEIVSTMPRLDLLSDLMDRFEADKLIAVNDIFLLRTQVNMLVHSCKRDWWEEAKMVLREVCGITEERMSRYISSTRCEARGQSDDVGDRAQCLGRRSFTNG
jgi:hypothetical protein